MVVGFDENELARLMLFAGITSIISLGLFLPRLISRVHEKGVIVVAFLSSGVTSMISVIVAGYYPHKWLVFAMISVGCLSTLSFPAIAALKSNNISDKVSVFASVAGEQLTMLTLEIG